MTGVTSSRKHPDGPVTCKYTDSPQSGQITGAENGSSRKLIGVVRCLHCPYLVATPEELRTALECRAQVLEESRTELLARAERDLDAARSRRGEMDTPGVNTLIADSALWSPDGGCGPRRRAGQLAVGGVAAPKATSNDRARSWPAAACTALVRSKVCGHFGEFVVGGARPGQAKVTGNGERGADGHRAVAGDRLGPGLDVNTTR
jgi:hypothetical protein